MNGLHVHVNVSRAGKIVEVEHLREDLYLPTAESAAEFVAAIGRWISSRPRPWDLGRWATDGLAREPIDEVARILRFEEDDHVFAGREPEQLKPPPTVFDWNAERIFSV